MKNIGVFWIKVLLVTFTVMFGLNLISAGNNSLGFHVPNLQKNLPLVACLIVAGVFFTHFIGRLFKFLLVFALFTPTYYIALTSLAKVNNINLDPTLIWVVRGISFSLAGLTYAYGMIMIKSICYHFIMALFSPIRAFNKYIIPKIKHWFLGKKGVPPCPINKTLEQIDKFGKGDTYEKGRQFEEYIAQMYRVIGYNAKTTTQLRAEGKLPHSIQVRGGSGEQGVDVIYSVHSPQGEAKKVIIQCKHYSSKVDNKAIQEIVGALKMYEAHHAVVITNSYFTKPARELAEANGVTLIDRDRLKEVIDRATSIYYKNYDARPKETDIKDLVA